MLEAKGIFQNYDGHMILNGISVDVIPGSVTVVLGESGSGKSTLLRTVALLDPPTAGVIEIEGDRVFPVGDIRHLRSASIGVVFQQFFTWPHLSVRDNLLIAVQKDGYDSNALMDICKRLNVAHLLERMPRDISLGERQRVSLVRSLLVKTRYLFLDEVTSAQDVHHVALIAETLKLMLKQKELGLFAVTHHLGFARYLMGASTDSRFLFLDHGVSIESGVLDVLDAPETSKLKKFSTEARLLG